ncbi:unnamed protein product [Lampetra planeri]
MGHQQIYFSHPRKFGQGSRSCRVCSNRHGLIRKYGLNMCRQCFRQYAKDIGFQKVRRLNERGPVPRNSRERASAALGAGCGVDTVQEKFRVFGRACSLGGPCSRDAPRALDMAPCCPYAGGGARL